MSDDPDLQAGSLGMSLGEVMAAYPEAVDESIITALLDRNDTLSARLSALLAYVDRVGGFSTAEDQLVIQEARAALGVSAVNPERQAVIDEWLAKRGGGQ